MALTRIGNTSIRTDTSFVFTANTTHTSFSTFTGANTVFTANVNFANNAGNSYVPVVDFTNANVVGIGGGGGAQANAITVYTAAQRFDANNITNAGGDGFGGSTVTLNFANNNYFDIDLANNIVLANPTNISNTQGGSIFLTQDATGSRTVTFGSYWRFPSGAAPSLSTAANAQDRLDYVVKSSNTIHTSVTLDLLGT